MLTIFYISVSIISGIITLKVLNKLNGGENFTDISRYNGFSEIDTNETNEPTTIPTPSNPPTPTPDIFFGFKKDYFYITFYGWPDNTPAGTEIAYPKSKFSSSKHNFAGGTGTYQDPTTFAAQRGAFPLGTIFYVPYLKKYIILEDICASCELNANHIDIWLESDERWEKEVLRCQRRFTREDELVIINPTSSLSVEKAALFDTDTGNCNNY